MRPKNHCLCSIIHPFDTRAEFVILIHPKEMKKVRNGTGRLTHLCLSRSRLVMGESFSLNPDVNGLISDPDKQAVILYPGDTALPAEEFLPSHGKSTVVFVMDGTWSGARKMMRISSNLHDLPKIKIVPESLSRFLIRSQPNPQCLSTIESVHALLDLWDRKGIENLAGRHDNLIQVLDELVRTQLSYIRNPCLEGYRRRNPGVRMERPGSSKRHKRYPYFNG